MGLRRRAPLPRCCDAAASPLMGERGGLCCCAARQQHRGTEAPHRPRKKRAAPLAVEPRPAAVPPPATTEGGRASALLPPTALGARSSRKPRSFESPGSPKVAAMIRKPRSFGAEGWLKVELPETDEHEQAYFRRVRNIVTGAHRGDAEAAFHGPVALSPGLHVGDLHDARDTDRIGQLGITHVLNCATAAETGTGAAFYHNRFSYLELGAQDSEIADFLAPHLQRASVFIDSALQVRIPAHLRLPDSSDRCALAGGRRCVGALRRWNQ